MVELKYHKTSRRFVLSLQLTRKYAVTSILENIISSKSISKQQIVAERELRARAVVDDDEVVATSQMVSLKDPVAYCRIQVPSRASTCQHIQCFDLLTYLTLNERIPTWVCPICSKSALYENLIVDGFFQELLEKAKGKDSVESAELREDGSWILVGEPEPKSMMSLAKMSKLDLGSDETVLIDDDDFDAPLSTQPAKHTSLPSATKKPTNQVEVIDLTSDSEEDRKPVPSSKYSHTIKTELASTSSHPTSYGSDKPSESLTHFSNTLHLPPTPSLQPPRYLQQTSSGTIVSVSQQPTKNGSGYPYQNLSSLQHPLLGMGQGSSHPQQPAMPISSPNLSSTSLPHYPLFTDYMHSSLNRPNNSSVPAASNSMVQTVSVSPQSLLLSMSGPYARQTTAQTQSSSSSSNSIFPGMNYQTSHPDSFDYAFNNPNANRDGRNQTLYADPSAISDSSRKRPLSDPCKHLFILPYILSIYFPLFLITSPSNSVTFCRIFVADSCFLCT
ncbi:hypothetical protein BC829DRAFT_227070 [Chytridium lagenaria]|nr:hypothetical protein BC829DRAFT_227070 [Chytridium lagenaria]